MATMKLGTSLRFLFPTSPQTHEAFRRTLAAAPAGSFIERPMGAYDTAEQARNWLEVAAAARAAGLDGLLVGDNHAVPAAYANCFAPVPSLARLMAVTGDMPVGMVLLAPFYEPIVLAEQIGTLAAFAAGPLIVTLALGGRAQTFAAFGREQKSRVGRLEELAAILRPLLGRRARHVPWPLLHRRGSAGQPAAARARRPLDRGHRAGRRRARQDAWAMAGSRARTLHPAT